jgi:predicted amidohydrolase YtcJ
LSAESPYTLVITHAELWGRPAGVDAVGISGTKIKEIGPTVDVLADRGGSCEVLDARGGYLMPGFHDAHGHQDRAARLKEGVQVQVQGKGKPVAAVQAAVRAYAAKHENEAWIQGGGWFMRSFGRHLPNKADLDKVEMTKPVALLDSTLHNLWVNSKALELAEITRDTPDPVGGKICRLPNGEPSGLLLETATTLVKDVIPPSTIPEIRRYIVEGERMSLTTGHTSAQRGPVGPTQIGVYADLDRLGLLTQRAFLWGELSATDDKFWATVAAAHALPPTGRVKLVGFKGFIDGVLAGKTAAVLNPYHNEPGNKGVIKISQADLDSLVLRANVAQFPVALHAVGDRAVRMALDSYENAKKVLGSTPRNGRNRVEHVSMIHPTDIPRFSSLNVVASVQPPLMYYPSRAEFNPDEVLGARRAEKLFRWKDLHDGGAPLVLGTDCPVGDLPPDPVTVLYCAVQRKFKDGADYTPDQRLPFDVAMTAYTATPAEIIGLDQVLGQLDLGYEADLVILERNPIGSKSVRDDPVVAVVVAGRRVVL